MSAKETIRTGLREISQRIERDAVSIDDAAYEIVGQFMSFASEEPDLVTEAEFEKIFDLAADVELGSEGTKDYKQKSEALRRLIKEI